MSEARFPIGPTLRHVEELYQPSVPRESALRLAEAAIVFADYELLTADFPQLADATPEQIDAWLLRHAALISSKQTAANDVNTAIATASERVEVVRPPRYGRALVAAVPGGGLLDIKGAGVQPSAAPSLRVYQSGLMFLGEALADFAYQQVMDRAFRYAESNIWSLPTYAILATGFRIFSDIGWIPAGLQIRRAHRRPLLGGDLPHQKTAAQKLKFEIEMILRHFGLTSCNAATAIVRTRTESGAARYSYAGQTIDGYTAEQQAAIEAVVGSGHDRFEGVNIQLIREFSIAPSAAQIVDFGHYEVRGRFDVPVVSLVADRLLRWGGALRPEHPRFVQPDPDLCLPLDEWGILPPAPDAASRRLPGTIRNSPVDLMCFEWASQLATGELSRSELAERFDALINRATASWWRATASWWEGRS